MDNSSFPLPPWRFDRVTAESMHIWVEALRDANPIHVDSEAADALGYGQRTVNPGPANLGYMINMIAAAVPLDYPLRVRAQFIGNVFSGDTVEVDGSRETDGSVRATLRVPERDEVVVELHAVIASVDR